MTKTNRRDWLSGGLESLGAEGLTGLKALRMANRLGMSRGSFYHHFVDQRDFEFSVFRYWRTEIAIRRFQELSNRLETGPSGRRRLSYTLTELVRETISGSLFEYDLAVRCQARYAPYRDEIMPIVREADDARQAILLELLPPDASSQNVDALFQYLLGLDHHQPQSPAVKRCIKHLQALIDAE